MESDLAQHGGSQVLEAWLECFLFLNEYLVCRVQNHEKMAVWDICMGLMNIFVLQRQFLSLVNKILDYLAKMKPALFSWGE